MSHLKYLVKKRIRRVRGRRGGRKERYKAAEAEAIKAELNTNGLEGTQSDKSQY